jgi:hypothetical protein
VRAGIDRLRKPDILDLRRFKISGNLVIGLSFRFHRHRFYLPLARKVFFSASSISIAWKTRSYMVVANDGGDRDVRRPG